MNTKQFIKIAEGLGWSVTKDRTDIELQQYTTFGQDFSFSVNRTEDYVKQVYEYYDSFDPSAEALLWCDDFGHGKNGRLTTSKILSPIWRRLRKCWSNYMMLYCVTQIKLVTLH